MSGQTPVKGIDTSDKASAESISQAINCLGAAAGNMGVCGFKVYSTLKHISERSNQTGLG